LYIVAIDVRYPHALASLEDVVAREIADGVVCAVADMVAVDPSDPRAAPIDVIIHDLYHA